MQQKYQNFTYGDVLAGIERICKGCIHKNHNIDDGCDIYRQKQTITFTNDFIHCTERNLNPTEIRIKWQKIE